MHGFVLASIKNACPSSCSRKSYPNISKQLFLSFLNNFFFVLFNDNLTRSFIWANVSLNPNEVPFSFKISFVFKSKIVSLFSHNFFLFLYFIILVGQYISILELPIVLSCLLDCIIRQMHKFILECVRFQTKWLTT